ncbi:MAG: MBL fold metallo-hydrolase [Methanomassiliicoccus sp.]|nr:MBL fold metallo-hydrolase [Methanomassiliicoccus sp.]
MRIIWHGHSCFEVKDAVTVVMDPHDGKSIGIKAPMVRADIVLVTHDHFDHNCVRIVKGDPSVVREPGERSLKGIKITGLATYHDQENGAKRGRNIIYRFDMDGIRFCHCGDLGHDLTEEQARAVGPIDVLFIPVGGVFTIDGGEALQLVKKLRPKVVIPMHFRWGGLSISIQTIDPFLKDIPEDAVLRVGNEVDFTREDLPTSTEVWVFSP